MQQELIETAKRQTARDPKFYVDTKSHLRGTFCEIVTNAVIDRFHPDDMILTYTVVHDAVRHTNHNQTTDDIDGARITADIIKRLTPSEWITPDAIEDLTETITELVRVARNHNGRART